MSELLTCFDTILSQTAPKIFTRLQPGLAIAEIETQISSFSWQFPQDAFDRPPAKVFVRSFRSNKIQQYSAITKDWLNMLTSIDSID